MSDLDAFEAKVRKNIKQLSSQDAKLRRESAAWLGEAGDPSAITRLRQLYEEDPDAGVRRAAAYSLGMFRALEAGLNSPEQEEVVQRLEDIALKNKFGSRSRIRGGGLGKLMLGLLVSLAILLLFNFLIWPQFGGQIAGMLGGAAAVNVPPALVARLEAAQTDAQTLRAQYLSVLGGGNVDCTTTFQQPAAYTLGEATEFTDEVQTLNSAIADLETARGPFDQACSAEAVALTAAEISTPLGTALGKLGEVETALGLGQAAAPANTPAPTVAPDSVATDEAVVVPAEQATEEAPTPVPDMRPTVVALLDMIDEMQTPRGPTALLNRYWEDIRDTGSTDGCSQPFPAVPENYVIPAELAGFSADLDLAVELVNTGLALTRQGWDQFIAACSSANPRESVDSGLQSARNATGSLNLAREQLNPLVG